MSYGNSRKTVRSSVMNLSIFWIYRRKFLYLLFCLGIFLIMLILISKPIYIPTKLYHLFFAKDSIRCYRYKKESLPDISSITPRRGNSIFFHETSCLSFLNEKITIQARQACAVESAARMNPDMDVYLLFTSPGLFNFEGTESDRILQGLLSYKNIRIMHLDYEKYIEGTPLEDLYQGGAIERSYYAQSHASDVLRYLTLWKYGGIYLDLDVVVIKSLKDLKSNYAGAESEENVAAGVLNFSPAGRGHELAQICVDDLKNNFNGHDWGHNGPGVVTRLIKTLCNARKAKDAVTKGCDDFNVYPEKYFYPVPWNQWHLYFNSTATDAVFNMTKSSYVVHVWNKHSTSTKIPKNSPAAYLKFAEKYCPKVVEECKEVF